MPDVTSKYLELGVDAKASSPEELAAQIKTEIVKWAAVIDKAGIPKQ
jgi:tripartite-type tricarboxylate transporter receptor subunit TctC